MTKPKPIIKTRTKYYGGLVHKIELKERNIRILRSAGMFGDFFTIFDVRHPNTKHEKVRVTSFGQKAFTEFKRLVNSI